MDFIDDFIEEYKNNPCLWKADSINFKNRSKRQEAYMRLISVAARHGEHYNVERTKQKINNLRCAFRHQLKKYTEYKNKNEKEELYCPKRKYFESLMFLKDEENREKKCLQTEPIIESVKIISNEIEKPLTELSKPEISQNNPPLCQNSVREPVTITNVKTLFLKDAVVNPIEEGLEEDKNIQTNQEPGDLSPSAANETTIDSQLYEFDKECLTRYKKQANLRKRSSSVSSQLTNETEGNSSKTLKIDFTPTDIEKLFSLAYKSIHNCDDYYTNFGKTIAHKLRNMESVQAIYAEKIIADVLFHGQMKLLSSVNTNQYLSIDCTTLGVPTKK